jgi:GT2 family glycosyltransferase
LETFLPSVIRHTPQDVAEIVVADNGSTDLSVAMLKERFPSVRLITFDRNCGFAEGYNKAISLIDSPCAVLLNSDVEVSPNWMDAPLAALDGNPSIAAVQPKIRSLRNKNRFEYAGAAGGFIDKYGYPYCRGRIMSVIEEDHGQYDTPVDVLWATGACLFIRTGVFREAGGFDPRFFAHQEEIDLCWRLRARGYRIVCTPESAVYHLGGATLSVESPHKTFLNFRNNLLMLYKNLPEKDLRHVFRLRFWLDALAAFKFLLSGHPRNAAAVFRARRDFHRLKQACPTIRTAQATRPHIPEIRTKSLLFSFYIERKRTFSKL